MQLLWHARTRGRRKSEATASLEEKMKVFYDMNGTEACETVLDRPGNLHDIKSHAYYVGEFSWRLR